MNCAIRPGPTRPGCRAPLRGPDDIWLSSAVAAEAGAHASGPGWEGGPI